MAVGAGRRHPGGDRAHALRRPVDGVRLQPGRLRDGLRLLRHRAGRLRPPAHRRRDRGAGGAGSPASARRRTAPLQRRVHGDGRAAGQLRRHLGGGASASTPTSGSRPATSPCRTVGIVPGIRRLAAEALPVNLAVSLHAADDELRDELVPINRRYPLSTLMDACAGLPPGQGPTAVVRVGADRRRQRPRPRRRPPRRAIAQPAPPRPRQPHPAQPHPGLRGAGVAGPPGARVPRPPAAQRGVNATVRRTRGTDIDAACGQLRASPQAEAAPVSIRPS